MTKRMLIDATQPEETRVVVVDGTRLDDFDFEASNQRQLKGNIYLAKVTRVEPSLQAAFIEYGGDRHGFLAFGEIHPDYYRIPVEDRQALIEAQEGPALRDPDDEADDDEEAGDGETEPESAEAAPADDTGTGRGRSRRQASSRRYRIQEVISRRQILLVQVVKEQRGNKGASLTTYLSLAGRYCVLMPNNPRGGGVSRKITSAADRNRLKQIVEDLDVPEGMAIIVRTAGRERTRTEIKRDCEYLLRLWDRIREQTLVSTAPCLVHEEANLIRRSIRDLYTRDIEEVLVQGDEGYRTAKSFMKMLIRATRAASSPSARTARRFCTSTRSRTSSRPCTRPRFRCSRAATWSSTRPRPCGDRRELRTGHPCPQCRGHRPADQSRGSRRDRAATAPAGPGRPDRDRLHRHGRIPQPDGGGTPDEGGGEG